MTTKTKNKHGRTGIKRSEHKPMVVRQYTTNDLAEAYRKGWNKGYEAGMDEAAKDLSALPSIAAVRKRAKEILEDG